MSVVKKTGKVPTFTEFPLWSRKASTNPQTSDWKGLFQINKCAIKKTRHVVESEGRKTAIFNSVYGRSWEWGIGAFQWLQWVIPMAGGTLSCEIQLKIILERIGCANPMRASELGVCPTQKNFIVVGRRWAWGWEYKVGMIKGWGCEVTLRLCSESWVVIQT